VRSNLLASTANKSFDNSRIAIVYRSPSELKTSRRLLRKHDKKQQEHIQRNLRKFNCVVPVLIKADGTIIDGHAIVRAARVIGLKEIPTVTIENLSDDEILALQISLHKIQEMSTWDPESLKSGLAYLVDVDSDLVSFTAFSTEEIDVVLSPPKESEAKPDPADQLPAIPSGVAVSRPGDIWLFKGGHALACGDAQDEEIYVQLMGQRRARLVIADPPYNVRIAGHVSGRPGVREFAAASGEMTSDEFTDFLRKTFRLVARHSVDGSMHLFFMDWRHIGEMMAAGWSVYAELKNLIVWAKTNAGMGSLWRSQHELIFAWKHGTAPHTNNVELGRHGRWRSNVWTYAGANTFGRHRDQDLQGHVTPKSVALIHDAILDVTARGDIVLDCFAGAGTTLAAAHRAKRISFGIEIDPLYVDTAVRRMEALTGEPARHAETGRTFAETTAERADPAAAALAAE
jgi:DNA modification methylase